MGHLALYNKNQMRDKISHWFFCFIGNCVAGFHVTLEKTANREGYVERWEIPMGRDSLYYIRDYSGNYYRTDSADQLIAVTSEQDAGLFTFAQANSHIGTGKKAAFYYMTPIAEESADMESSESSEPVIVEPSENTSEEENISPIKELTYDEIAEQVERNASSYDLSEMDWAEYLTHFTYLVAGLKGYREELIKKQSDMDQKICDILHYIELCETSDEEAIDLIELLRVCRENRRDAKDELQRVESFQTNFGTNANAIKAQQALKSMKGLENRKYKPRKYEELFENCVMKERRLQRSDIVRKESGEETMTDERIYTPFDGKENDWLSFAKQQAEFYRNAGQYIRNLQMDIQDIDAEIEEILQRTEDANCNVTQGYKVFKRLKELRLERKVKLKELNCVHALADYVDCDALADTCEANLADVQNILGMQEETDIPLIEN